mmetsp:Transcript_4405/g.15479  ORF Transcript_4405/g.15479 Transcript_4405/m.15479 type:complete len:218 (+) Transcript_4405:992-1645(+)
MFLVRRSIWSNCTVAASAPLPWSMFLPARSSAVGRSWKRRSRAERAESLSAMIERRSTALALRRERVPSFPLLSLCCPFPPLSLSPAVADLASSSLTSSSLTEIGNHPVRSSICPSHHPCSGCPLSTTESPTFTVSSASSTPPCADVAVTMRSMRERLFLAEPFDDGCSRSTALGIAEGLFSSAGGLCSADPTAPVFQAPGMGLGAGRAAPRAGRRR